MTRQSGTIYRHALQFYVLAKPAFSDDGLLEGAPLAVVANLALCVELLLKSTDAKAFVKPRKEGKPLLNGSIESKVRGHELSNLLEKLNATVRSNLIEHYAKATDCSLKADIEKCSDYFVHSRYGYELAYSHSYDIGVLKRLADGLIKAINSCYGEVPATVSN